MPRRACLLLALAAACVAAAPASAGLTIRYTSRVDPRLISFDAPQAVIEVTTILRRPRGVAGTFHLAMRDRRSTLLFLGRLRFREGRIFARQVVGPRTREFRLRITGGTGRFRHARGDVTTPEGRGDRFVLVLRLR